MLKTVSGAALQPIAREGALPPVPERGCTPLWELFPSGHMLELSGQKPGKLSTAVRLIARAQAQGEPVAWVGLRDSATFYAPDFEAAGVDLNALAVVRLGESAGPHGVVRAAEVLLRSGAFGLVILDLSQDIPKGELSWQARLSGLLRHHDARAVLITNSREDEMSLGPLVSLRVAPSLREEGKRVLLRHQVLKSKLAGGVAISPDLRGLPAGA